MAQREVVVTSGVRTAIGDYGGSLKDVAPTALGAICVREAVSRAKIDPASVGHVVFGSVIHGEAKDMYFSRVAAIEGGLPVGTPCLTVNRLCGSGLQAIVSAAQHILLGDTDVALGAGAESMSRAAYFMPAARWGQRMGDSQLIDAMTAALHDPFGHGHMGVTAENIAAKYGITREEQDAFALESHKRAAKAIDAGHFRSQIIPVEVKAKKGPAQFDTDEHVRKDATLADLQKLKTVFKKDGTVTAGNASGINDAAAAVVLMEKSGLKPADMDVIESNEAFAVQAMAVTRDLGLDPAKVNPNGGAVALGHPIGATGCLLAVKAIYELHRTHKRYALVTMCIGGGQGIAAIFERMLCGLRTIDKPWRAGPKSDSCSAAARRAAGRTSACCARSIARASGRI